MPHWVQFLAERVLPDQPPPRLAPRVLPPRPGEAQDPVTTCRDGAPWCPIFGPDQSAFNADHALQTDLDKPVIIVTLEFDRPAILLIDGVHRMYRAMIEGRETLPAHTLTAAETATIRES
ncbi:hypothetical protein SUDANB105_00024 [Streptomyces sp. enrichment culture]